MSRPPTVPEAARFPRRDVLGAHPVSRPGFNLRWSRQELGLVLLLWTSHYAGWILSGFVHLGLALILAEWVLPQGPVETVIDAIFASQDRDPKIQPETFDEPLRLGELDQDEGGGAPPSAFDPREFLAELENAERPYSSNPSAGTGSGVGTGSGDGGDGNGSGGGKIGFFGTAGTGNSVVFVVDMSGSMENRNRFARARVELIHAIVRLQSTQKFYVIFFNSGTYPLFYPKPAAGLVLATTEMKNRTKRWINDRAPSSNTNPEPAIQLALALKPDLMYLLTDGEIPSSCRTTARQFNLSETAIHTLAFHSQQGEAILKAIAKENHGTYRYVK